MNEIEHIEALLSSPKFIRENPVLEIDKLISRLNNLFIIMGTDYQYKRTRRKVIRMSSSDYFGSIAEGHRAGRTLEELELEQRRRKREKESMEQKRSKNFSTTAIDESLMVDIKPQTKKLVMKIADFHIGKCEDDLPF